MGVNTFRGNRPLSISSNALPQRIQRITAKELVTGSLTLPKHEGIAQAVEKHRPIRFSRIPIYGRDLNDIIGIVHRYRLLELLSAGKGCQELQSIAVPIHAIPDTANVASALEQFIKRKEQIFLVVDEYGGTAGILTLEDAIETLLGVEIVDELDNVEDMRKWAVQLWERHKQKCRS